MLALPVAEFVALSHNTTYLGYSQSGTIASPAAAVSGERSKERPVTFFAGSPKHSDMPHPTLLRQVGVTLTDLKACVWSLINCYQLL